MQQHKLTTGLALAALLGIGLATPAYADGGHNKYERGHDQGYRDGYRHEDRHGHGYRHNYPPRYEVRRTTYVVRTLPGHHHDRHCDFGRRHYVEREVVHHHHEVDRGWSVVIHGDNFGLRF